MSDSHSLDLPPPGQRITRHGWYRTKTYKSWHSMKARCLNQNDPSWRRYGGRGITVCERWLTFANFLADMGARPSDATLDRIDPNGNYEPSNCRWAGTEAQNNNRRKHVLVVFGNREMTLAQFARMCDLVDTTVARRLRRGWSPERIASTRPIPPAERLREGRRP